MKLTSLRQIAQWCGGAVAPEQEQVMVNGLCHDTRELDAGALFFALTGTHDGHDYLKAAKAAGADVTHLDSVRQVVTWARDNMDRSGLDGIRWVVEDAMKFARREARRGNLYQGIILDPPAYGHGPDGEKWKLDELLFDLLKNVAAILAPRDSFMVLNLYSNGYSAMLGETLVHEAFGHDTLFRDISSGELALKDSFGKVLPLSIFVRVKR